MTNKTELEQLSRFFETSTDLMCVADPQGAFLHTNPAFTEVLGYSESELIARPFVEFIHPEDKQRTIDEMADQIRTGFSLNFENRYLCKDGTVKWLSWRAVYDQALGTTYAIARDVTDRKREEALLRQANALITQIINTIPNMVFLKDARELRFVEFNKAGEDLIGFTKAEVLGKNDYDFFPKEQADFFTNKDREVLNCPGVVDIPEERVETKLRGTRILHTKKVAVRNEAGQAEYLLGISEDITDLKQMEVEKSRLQSQLQQSLKLESLGSLAGGIAHDMNNVLSAILGLATANLTNLGTDTPLHRTFETISRAAERGGKMVRSLLSFARQTPVEDKPVDLNRILRDEVSLLERTTQARVQLILDLDPDLLLVRGDAGSLSSAIMNICVNAVDAIPGQGRLTLISRNLPNREVEIQVQDTGTGMSKEVLEKAMDPFFTTKPSGRGTGMGLSLVYGTIKSHGGTMEILSQPGKGTTVVIRLPACLPETVPVAPREVDPATCQDGLHILLVDDDELIQDSMGELLSVLGHQVTMSNSGEAALTRIDQGLVPDLIILDMNMPGLGGPGSLPLIRQRLATVPIILSTGRSDQDAQALVANFTGVNLLAKPFSIQDFKTTLAGLGLKK